MIKNPDFSDISIIYSNGKVVLPRNWDSFDKLNFPYFFSHPAKYPNKNIFAESSSLPTYNGFITLDLLNPNYSNGFFTELKSTLEAGQAYNIEIELKVDKVLLNSDYSTNQYNSTGEKIDSADLDYNYIISLVTYFTTKSTDSLDIRGRKFVIFDLPKSVTPDSTEKWYKLSKTFIADGNEKYYSLGTDNAQDYIQILKIYKGDTVYYDHKWTRYLVRKVSIIPIFKEFTISDTFEPDSIIIESDLNMKFVIRNINFGLDSYDLNEVSITETKKIAEFLKTNEQINLRIIGHTDTIGTIQYNQELSEKRAFSIYNFLINQGINKERLKYEGKGEFEPLKEFYFKGNLDKNRRVEFEFMKY